MRLRSRSLFLILCFILIGCGYQEKADTQKWLQDLAFQSGLVEENATLLDCTNALVQWGVNEDLLTEGELSKEKAAAILSSFYDFETNEEINIQDIKEAAYPNEIKNCISLGLFELKNNKFYPKQILTTEEANLLLEQFILLINQAMDEEYFELELKDGIDVKQVEPYRFNQKNRVAQFNLQDDIQNNDVVCIDNHLFYKIDEIEDGIAELKPLSFDEVEYLNMAVKLSLDTDKIEFIPATSISYSYKQQETGFVPVSYGSYYEEFTVNGITIRVRQKGSSFSIYGFKETALNRNLYFEFVIEDFNPSFSFKGNLNSIDRAWLKMDLKSTVSAGIKKGEYKQLILDANKFNSDDWLTSLKQAWTFQSASVDTILPIGKILIPIENFPGFVAVLDLKIKLDVEGKVELLYSVEHEFGFEIKNNQLRKINDCSKDLDGIFEASCGVAASLLCGLNFGNLRLIDAAIDLGIQSEVKSTIHLFEDGISINEEDIPYDVLEDLSLNQDNISVCGDLAAYWTGTLNFNSYESAAYKLGITYQHDFLDKNNAALFNGSVKHIENLQFVEKCTKQDLLPTLPTISVTEDRIILISYSCIVNKNESISLGIRGLPKGYKKSDLCFVSEDTSIAQVNQQGVVRGIHAGSTNVIISIKDTEFQVKCNILVRSS